jgi:hypothetical protein
MDHLSVTAPLLWLLLLIPLGIGFHLTLVDRPRTRRLVAFLLRALGLVLLVLSLCRPTVFTESTARHLCFLIDVSESVELSSSMEALQEVEEQIKALEAKDSSTCFLFGRSLIQGTPAELRKRLEEWKQGVGGGTFRSESALAPAALASRLTLPEGKAALLILYSDGKPTRGRRLSSPYDRPPPTRTLASGCASPPP